MTDGLLSLIADAVTADVKKYRQISSQLGITTLADITGC